jgi:TM2 domain-containing membrane protein YozV
MTDLGIRITVRHDEENCGPYALSDVNALLLSGQLDSDDLAWVEGTPDWVPLAEIDGVAQVPSRRQETSTRRILPAFLLAWFVGPFGIHRFYAGRVGSGVAMLLLTLTLVGLIVTGIWVLVDLIILACGNFRDGDGVLMKEWT